MEVEEDEDKVELMMTFLRVPSAFIWSLRREKEYVSAERPPLFTSCKLQPKDGQRNE